MSKLEEKTKNINTQNVQAGRDLLQIDNVCISKLILEKSV